MPPDSDPQHPVWSVHPQILEYQLFETHNLSDHLRGVTNKDVGDILTDLIRGLALGWDQKTFCKAVTHPDCPPGHPDRDVLKELSSWVFATQGVLSHIYQPVLTPYAADAVHGAPHGSEVVDDLNGQNWGTPMSQGSSLLGLPNELLDKVLKHLPARDVNDWRLTCRESRHRSFDLWSKTFFVKRQFMIDGYSLQTLLDISRHPELRSVLTHLIIGVDEVNTKDTLAVIHRNHANDPSRAAAMFRYWRDAALAQEALLQTGRAIELLSQALSNLTELKTVSISGSGIPRGGPLFPHAVYYPHLGLRSYGAAAYESQPRDGDLLKPNSKGFPDKVFSCVLNSLVRSSPEKLVTLQTNLDGCGFLPHLKDEAFYLPPLAPHPAERLTFPACLTELDLDVNLESRSMRRIPFSDDHRHTFDPVNTSLRQLLRACPNLSSLTLRVLVSEKPKDHCDFTAWLAETADNPIDPPMHWPFLRKLVLQGMHMSPATLRNTFVKFDTLKSVILSGVVLRECFVDHPVIAHDSQEPLENHWANFLRESAAQGVLSNLESLELRKLEVARYREHPDVAVQQTWHDFDVIVYVDEELHPGDEALNELEVTDFGQEALEAAAELMWFFEDWVAEKASEHSSEASDSGED